MTELEKFEQYVQEYTSKNHIDEVQYNDEVTVILNYKTQDLESITEQQCLSKAFLLTSFCLFLQSEYNQTVTKLDWCNETINRIVAESYNDFDKYMKYEIRRSSVILNNDFAKTVEDLRRHLQARHSLLSNKIEDVRSIAKILEQLARKKGYESYSKQH